MKFLVKTILAAGLTILLSPYFPFWASAIAILILNFVVRTGGWSSFFSGFFGMGITWSVYAWMLSAGDATLINEKISEVFMGLPSDLMFLIAGTIGAITGGISGLTGFLLTPKKVVKSSGNPYH